MQDICLVLRPLTTVANDNQMGEADWMLLIRRITTVIHSPLKLRRISENVFGIWVSRFRVFLTRMNLNPEKAVLITLASIVLHNMLCTLSSDSYTPDGFIDCENEAGDVMQGAGREENLVDFVRQLHRNKSNMASHSAEHIRDIFADHFNGPGQIPWQWKMI